MHVAEKKNEIRHQQCIDWLFVILSLCQALMFIHQCLPVFNLVDLHYHVVVCLPPALTFIQG